MQPKHATARSIIERSNSNSAARALGGDSIRKTQSGRVRSEAPRPPQRQIGNEKSASVRVSTFLRLLPISGRIGVQDLRRDLLDPNWVSCQIGLLRRRAGRMRPNRGIGFSARRIVCGSWLA